MVPKVRYEFLICSPLEKIRRCEFQAVETLRWATTSNLASNQGCWLGRDALTNATWSARWQLHPMSTRCEHWTHCAWVVSDHLKAWPSYSDHLIDQTILRLSGNVRNVGWSETTLYSTNPHYHIIIITLRFIDCYIYLKKKVSVVYHICITQPVSHKLL